MARKIKGDDELNLNLPSQRTMEIGASLWKRIGAFLLDLVILDFIVFYPFRNILTSLVPTMGSFSEVYVYLTTNPTASAQLNFIILVIALLSLAYFAILESKLGYTIGKYVFHIRVTTIDASIPRSFWRCIVRNLFLIPYFPFIMLWLVDPIYMALTKENQRLCEVITKTKVVEDAIVR